MNRHRHKRLLKRTKFLRWRVKEDWQKRKQNQFERDLRNWKQSGLKKSPHGWTTSKMDSVSGGLSPAPDLLHRK
ncbi:hypothetical protein MHYP_G00038880 [Metynnis hypsauchen]